MNLNDYKIWTRSTAIYPENMALEYLALGLCSEAGEVAGKVKKYIRDGGFNSEALEAEIGDVFWYLCRLVDTLGADPCEILQSNIDKLEDRKHRDVIKGSGDNR